MEPLWVVKVRRNYRPWWAPWRTPVPFEYRVWRDGRRVDDVFEIEIFKSLYKGTSVKLNGSEIVRGQVWVDGEVYVQVPDISATLRNTDIHMVGQAGEIKKLDWSTEEPEPYVFGGVTVTGEELDILPDRRDTE